MASGDSELHEVSPDRIDANRDNPRLIFREGEMNRLLDSIREVGIQVPLSIYRRGDRYTLIDGERRWRCARKLNLSVVPALVQPEPSPLENLLTMFNIHNVRSDWDLMPMALKLADVARMLETGGQSAGPRDLASLTGVSLPTVRRALELLELPQRYQALLLKEAEKPKEQQTITADVFVEINKSRRVIERYAPEVFDDVKPAKFVDAMVDKYQSGVVNNVVRYRDISKIARVERAGGDVDDVTPTLVRLATDQEYKIEDAYKATVERAYQIRDAATRVEALLDRLTSIQDKGGIPDDLRGQLRALRKEIDRLLRTG